MASFTPIGDRVVVQMAEAAKETTTGIALALDDGTRKSHSVAENTAFVTGFFRGIGTRDAFAQLVASLYFVYQAMEKAFDESEGEWTQHKAKSCIDTARKGLKGSSFFVFTCKAARHSVRCKNNCHTKKNVMPSMLS